MEHPPDFTFGSSAALVALLVYFQWRGQDLGRGARIGLAYGAASAFLPVAMHVVGLCCNLEMGAEIVQKGLCVASGLMAGLLVARVAAKIEAQSPTQYVVAASLVGSVAGSLGCSHMGIGGMLGVTAGVWLATVPVLVVRRFA